MAMEGDKSEEEETLLVGVFSHPPTPTATDHHYPTYEISHNTPVGIPDSKYPCPHCGAPNNDYFELERHSRVGCRARDDLVRLAREERDARRLARKKGGRDRTREKGINASGNSSENFRRNNAWTSDGRLGGGNGAAGDDGMVHEQDAFGDDGDVRRGGGGSGGHSGGSSSSNRNNDTNDTRNGTGYGEDDDDDSGGSGGRRNRVVGDPHWPEKKGTRENGGPALPSLFSSEEFSGGGSSDYEFSSASGDRRNRDHDPFIMSGPFLLESEGDLREPTRVGVSGRFLPCQLFTCLVVSAFATLALAGIIALIYVYDYW